MYIIYPRCNPIGLARRQASGTWYCRNPHLIWIVNNNNISSIINALCVWNRRRKKHTHNLHSRKVNCWGNIKKSWWNKIKIINIIYLRRKWKVLALENKKKNKPFIPRKWRERGWSVTISVLRRPPHKLCYNRSPQALMASVL